MIDKFRECKDREKILKSKGLYARHCGSTYYVENDEKGYSFYSLGRTNNKITTWSYDKILKNRDVLLGTMKNTNIDNY